MNIRTFFDNMAPAERRAFAKKIGTTPAYLAQLHYGCKQPGPAMARRLHEASGQRLPLASMRPDIWGRAA